MRCTSSRIRHYGRQRRAPLRQHSLVLCTLRVTDGFAIFRISTFVIVTIARAQGEQKIPKSVQHVFQSRVLGAQPQLRLTQACAVKYARIGDDQRHLLQVEQTAFQSLRILQK